ncbi:DUS23 phosphatase, partial [Poecile atricapillus]|nr:DUS23 phosphatase [Poecile atricapillus]
ASEPPNFSWVVEGRLAGLAMPREPGHYRYLRDHGVRHLVSLTEHAPPHHGCCPQIQLHRLPGIACHPGSATGSTGGSGSATHPPCPCPQAVAVHCMLGHGRTGTLLACYLCKEQHLAGGDAIREIRRLRPGSIETAEQERAVIHFCQCLR